MKATTAVLSSSRLRQLKNLALEFGFDHCSATPALISERNKRAYLAWCADGLAGDLAYMTKNPAQRTELPSAYPQIKCVLTLGVSYYQGPFPPKPGPHFGRVARYAWGLDYHEVIQERLRALINRLVGENFVSVSPLIAVDTKPLLERALAESAHMGFIGKNTVLIVPREIHAGGQAAVRYHVGSWIFLAEVLLDMELEEDPPAPPLTGCGGCTKCLVACPTGAFEDAYRLRAEKCISYLTIENKGGIPLGMRAHLGEWVFGCDICQDVCPFNAHAFETRWPEFRGDRGAGAWVSLPELLSIPDQASLKKRWGHTPFLRAKRRGMVRNACVAAGNSGADSLVPFLVPLLSDTEPVVRAHALWALSRLDPSTARRSAERQRRVDNDESVLAECRFVLDS